MNADDKVQIAQDICALTLVHRVAALLDRDIATLSEGFPLPRGWHVALFTASTPQALLRPDGVGGLGFKLPASDLPRMVMGGKRTRFLGDIPIGSRVVRESRMASVVDKVGRSGPMCLMTVLHQVRVEGDPAVVLQEEQDYLMLTASTLGDPVPDRRETLLELEKAECSHEISFDETMIFRYSAITFNAHRIHYDKEYAANAESYPGVLVNGGLSALCLLEMAKSLDCSSPIYFASRNTAPLFCGKRVRLCASPYEKGRRLWIDDVSGRRFSTADAVFS